MNEKLAIWIAWRLPKSIAKWAYIRVAAHATVTEFQDKAPDQVNLLQALKSWDTA